MSSPNELIGIFARSRKIKSNTWAVQQVGEILSISGIPDRNHAGQLAEFLADKGMNTSLVMGDKRGTIWNVIARTMLLPQQQVQQGAA